MIKEGDILVAIKDDNYEGFRFQRDKCYAVSVAYQCSHHNNPEGCIHPHAWEKCSKHQVSLEGMKIAGMCSYRFIKISEGR